MPRYIDADALEKKLQNTTVATVIVTPFNRKWVVSISRIIGRIFSIIKEFPTADVEKVRHGRWIDKGHFSLLCDKCGAYVAKGLLLNDQIYYCPHCGAKMDGKENEND